MILADSSIWIDYLRKRDESLKSLLADERILISDFIIGELAIGFIEDRKVVLEQLNSLQKVIIPSHDEVMTFLEKHKLMSTGLSYIDVTILMSALISNCKLWTADKALKTAAIKLGCAYSAN